MEYPTIRDLREKMKSKISKDDGGYSAVKEKFNKAVTLEEVISIVWKLPEAPTILKPYLILSDKSEANANRLRIDGDIEFDEKRYDKAIEYYTLSIMIAPHPSYPACSPTAAVSDNDVYSLPNINPTRYRGSGNAESRALAVGFASRATVLFELSFYKKCLRDIDFATQYGYPQDQMHLLDGLKEKCLATIERARSRQSVFRSLSSFWSSKEQENISNPDGATGKVSLMEKRPVPLLPFQGLPSRPSRSPQRYIGMGQSSEVSKCSRFPPQSSLVSPQSSIVSPQRSLDSPQRSLGSPQRSLDSPQRSLGSPQRSLGSPQRSLGSPQRSLDSPQRLLEPHQRALGSPQHSLGSSERSLDSSECFLDSPERSLDSPLGSPKRLLGSPQCLLGSPQGSLDFSQCSLDSSQRSQGSYQLSQDSSQRSQDSSQRSEGSSQRSEVSSQRVHGSSQRAHGSSQRAHGYSQRSQGYFSQDSSQRSQDSSQRSQDSSQRSEGSFQRAHGSSQRAHGSYQRSQGSYQLSQDSSQRSQDSSQRSEESSQGSYKLSQDSSQRSQDSSQRSEGSSQRSEGSSQRSEGSSQRSHGSSHRAEGSSQRAHDSSQHAHGSSQRAQGFSQRAQGFSQRSDVSPSRSRAVSPRRSRAVSPRRLGGVSPRRLGGVSPRRLGGVSPRRSGGVSPRRSGGVKPRRSRGVSPRRSGGESPLRSRGGSPLRSEKESPVQRRKGKKVQGNTSILSSPLASPDRLQVSPTRLKDNKGFQSFPQFPPLRRQISPQRLKWSPLNSLAIPPCLKLGGRSSPIQELLQQQMCESPKITEPNEKIQSFTKNVKPCHDPIKGRCVVAIADLEPGDVVAVERGHSTFIEQTMLSTYCSSCLKLCITSIPCPSCTQVVFCDEVCRQKALSEDHWIECRLLPTLIKLGMTRRAVIFKLLKAATYNKLKDVLEKLKNDVPSDASGKGFDSQGIYHSSSYRSIQHLQFKKENVSFEDLYEYAQVAIILTNLLNTGGRFFVDSNRSSIEPTRKDLVATAATLLKHILMYNSNGVQIFDYKRMKEIGGGFFPALAMVRHSCHPSLKQYNCGRVLVFRAVRPILAGEEVTVGYISSFEKIDLSSRIYLLQNRGACDCEACINKWDQDMEKIVYKCLNCNVPVGVAPRFCQTCLGGEKHSTMQAVDVIDEFVTMRERMAKLRIKLIEGVPASQQDFKYLCQALQVLHDHCVMPSRIICAVQNLLAMCFADGL